MTVLAATESSHLQLWRLLSPQLPIGAYSYSTGLEAAVEAGWVTDEASAYAWSSGILNHSLAQGDIPILARCYRAWQIPDFEQVVSWSRLLLALRESRELRLEDQQLGQALRKLLLPEIPALAAVAPPDCSYAALFAAACVQAAIPLSLSAHGLAFAWCENQVSAAIKLIPLGQTAGQRILSRLLADIPGCITHGLQVETADIGMTLPGLALGSAWHETQYSRLFRS